MSENSHIDGARRPPRVVVHFPRTALQNGAIPPELWPEVGKAVARALPDLDLEQGLVVRLEVTP
jgi:hypothetical protein